MWAIEGARQGQLESKGKENESQSKEKVSAQRRDLWLLTPRSCGRRCPDSPAPPGFCLLSGGVLPGGPGPACEQSQKGAKLGGEQPVAAGYPLVRPPVSLFSNSVVAASISSVSSSVKWAYECVPSEALGKTQWTGGPPGP